MRPYRLVSALFLTILLSATMFAQALFVKPTEVFGDPNFIGTAANPLLFDSTGPNLVEGRELLSPQGIAVDNSVQPPIIYIADTFNNRVLAYRYNTTLTQGSFADLVLGQPNRFTNLAEGPGTSLTTGLSLPTGLAVDGQGNLYVADTGDNRVVRYAQPFAQPAGYQFPNLIIGQKSFSTGTANAGGIGPTTLQLNNGSYLGRTGIAIDPSGNLWVADIGNNRILRFPASALAAGANAPTADTVVGQQNMITATAANTPLSTTALNHPTGVSFDSSGNMLVSDQLSRGLVFTAPIGTNAAASIILGLDATTQPPNASSADAGNPTSVIATAQNVLLVDAAFSRVMIYPTVSQMKNQSFFLSPSALEVIGQGTFSGNQANQKLPAPTSGTLSSPVDAATSTTELFVVDSGNNRVIVYPLGSVGGASSPTGSRVIGQLDFPYNAPNLIVGAEFNLASSSSGGASGSVVLDYSATPPHLYVSDTGNNRILGFKNFTSYQNGNVADLVIGQPNLFSSIVNYGSSAAISPGLQGLNSPTGMAVDSSGNLYVADTLNSRVVRFPAPFASGKTAAESADLIIGQSGSNSTITDATQSTLSAPVGLAFTQAGFNTAQPNSGWLVVTDGNQNRTLMFPKPFATGMNASVVLGQPTFTSSTSGNTAALMSSPRGVAVDPQDNILVADSGNSRVDIFDSASTLTSGVPANLTLTNGLRQPTSIAMGSNGQFWVGDPSQNQLFHFPAVSNLPLKNYAFDATQPAVSPRSAAVDSYNNLLVADGIDRLLYFAPQASMVNAASFIPGRALAPGTFAAIFPTVSTNLLAPAGSTAQIATTLPFPGALGDIQVLINGSPSPLYFVSTGQINTALSLSLPSGGTVDMKIVRQSTGQILAAAEIPLASASPGLFTLGSSSTGQVAAINAVDGTVNSATNPVVRGQFIELFGTGQGFVPGGPADGQAPTGPVPTPATPQILLGSSTGATFIPASDITYSGLAPSLVDVWQINVQIPATAPAGANVPITVFMNNIPNTNPNNPTEIVTTISIK